MITPAHITLVQNSFEHIRPIADTAAVLFYERLFVLDPTLRALFPADLREQRRKLMTVLGIAVAGLSRLEELVPVIQQLGIRHRGYGVKDAHYPTVGAALLWMLEQVLREQFTPDVQAAWSRAYTLLAGTMRAAAAASSPQHALKEALVV